MNQDQLVPLIVLLIIAVSINLPLGYLREASRKYSLRWVVLIHASIPVLVIMRQFYGFSWHWIPVTLGCAVLGQVLGGRMRRRRKS